MKFQAKATSNHRIRSTEQLATPVMGNLNRQICSCGKTNFGGVTALLTTRPFRSRLCRLGRSSHPAPESPWMPLRMPNPPEKKGAPFKEPKLPQSFQMPQLGNTLASPLQKNKAKRGERGLFLLLFFFFFFRFFIGVCHPLQLYNSAGDAKPGAI